MSGIAGVVTDGDAKAPEAPKEAEVVSRRAEGGYGGEDGGGAGSAVCRASGRAAAIFRIDLVRESALGGA